MMTLFIRRIKNASKGYLHLRFGKWDPVLVCLQSNMAAFERQDRLVTLF